MMEIASASVDQTEINAMVEAMFVKSGLEGNTSLNFEDFFSLLGQQGHLLSRASLDWKGRMAIYYLTAAYQLCLSLAWLTKHFLIRTV